MRGEILNVHPHTSSKSTVNIAVAEACIIGLAAALGAVALKYGVGFVGSFRVQLAEEWAWYLPIIGLVGGLTAGGLIQWLAPGAAGSGIPQTKAALTGNPIRLDLMTALVKLTGCITSLGSGLALGREGPTVQISAALASKFSGWLKTSPTHRIQLIAAGAGAGLAAAFNAPLAGVLFVLEELIKKMSGMAVGTTVVACFVAAVTSRLVGVHSLDINISELVSQATFRFIDIPFLILLGFVSGVVASIFNKTLLAAMTFNRDIIKLPTMVSCGIAGLITGLVIMHLPDLYWNYAGLRIMLIQDATTNHVIMVALVMQIFLTLLAYGLGAPGGLFAPSLTIGACLGHLVAVFEMYLMNYCDISTMSVVGMGAFFCAVARVPMTAVVIVFEMTQDFNVVLPLMVSCVVAYLVAERLDPGSIYDRLMLWSGFSPHEETEDGIMNKLKARSFMTKQVWTIPNTANLELAVATFEEHGHNGFPIVDENHKVVGIVAQPDLKRAKAKGLKETASINEFMTPKPITVSGDEPLSGVLYLMDRYKVSRLPVVEADKLIGIITRKDVVSAESQAFGMRTTSGSRSYPIYQTRSPETGNGRILVAVGDPKGADSLVRTAAAFAKARNYELECLHVITVPLEKSPSTTDVSTEEGRNLVEKCRTIGLDFGIPIHTSIRVAHDVSEAIAETISDRNITIFLMRYFSSQRARGSDLLIQSILSRSTCSVILLGRRFHQSKKLRCILPVAETLEPLFPVEVLVNLCSAESTTVSLCRVESSKSKTTNATESATSETESDTSESESETNETELDTNETEPDTIETEPEPDPTESETNVSTESKSNTWTYAKTNNTTDATTNQINQLRELFERKHNFVVETETRIAKSPAALLKNLVELEEHDLIILGLPRAYLAKAINQGVFRKYLNRINNKYAIIITAQETAT